MWRILQVFVCIHHGADYDISDGGVDDGDSDSDGNSDDDGTESIKLGRLARSTSMWKLPLS